MTSEPSAVDVQIDLALGDFADALDRLRSADHECPVSGAPR